MRASNTLAAAQNRELNAIIMDLLIDYDTWNVVAPDYIKYPLEAAYMNGFKVYCGTDFRVGCFLDRYIIHFFKFLATTYIHKTI